MIVGVCEGCDDNDMSQPFIDEKIFGFFLVMHSVLIATLRGGGSTSLSNIIT